MMITIKLLMIIIISIILSLKNNFIKKNIQLKIAFQKNNVEYTKSLLSKKSTKKLVIALFVDSEIHNNNLVNETINSILNLNNNYTLYIICNKICPIIHKNNIFIIKDFFIYLFTAFNSILNSINIIKYDYITFLTPGDLVKPSTYDFLDNIEDHDIYQISESNESTFIKKPFNHQINNYTSYIFDFVIQLPNNTHNIHDKIYNISLLKNNNIRFINHKNSIYYFNLLAFSYAKDLLYINNYGIFHNIYVENQEYNDNMYQEAYIFRKIISANRNLTKDIIENMNKVDYVFPYVTTEDPYWNFLYNKSLSGNENDYVSGFHRFRDNGLLKYLFRGLEAYMPWINKVHMIVMCESQVPKWVNRDKIHIIYHSDFIPKKFLPTFNSNLIETFLPLLPLDEDKFIYSNDDMFPCRKLSKELFFKGNIPCYNIYIRDYFATAPGDYLRRNAFNLITGEKQEKRVVSTQHSAVSFKLSLLKNCFKKYKKSLLKTLSKFREIKNVNQYFYSFYQMMEGTIINHPQKIISYSLKPDIVEKIINIDFKRYDYICLNDDIDMKEKDWKKIQIKFQTLLPKKSKYEI